MDTEISAAGNLKEKRTWGGNVKVYTRRNFRNKNLENISTPDSDFTAEAKCDEKGSDIIADQCLRIEEKDNDTISDKYLQNVAIEDLNVEKDGENESIQDQSVQIVATEGLDLIQGDKSSTLYDKSVEIINSGNSDSDVTTEEKKDGKGYESEFVAEENLRIESYTINVQSLQIRATENLNNVQEDEGDTLHDQSLQINAREDFSSDQNNCNDTTHDQFSEVANDSVLDNPLQNVVTLDLDSAQESENASPLNSGGNNISSAHDHPQQVSGESECEKRNINGSDKSIGFKVNGRVRINLEQASPKNEIRGLKRKLEDELDQVKSLVHRLEAKKIQLSSYYQVDKVRALNRVNSVVGSVTCDSRPYQNLSVQVFENEHDVNVFVEKRTPKENRYYQSSDFLFAKDRLTPPDSNKKLKTNAFLVNKYTLQALKSCNNLLARLMRHKFAWVFNKPVDAKALGLHDYHYIIKSPMDLGTIKSRLGKDFYTSPREFAEDVRLTFCNAMTYNPKGQDVHVMAEQLLTIFEDKWAAIELEYNYCFSYFSRKVHPPPPRSLSRPPPLDMIVLERAELMTMPMDYFRLKPNTPVGKIPVPKKPKVKDVNKRDMTYDEKQRLSMQLQNLPSDKLDTIVQIIKKGNSSLSQHDDEIEVDIDSVDTETLWELDRLVTNYKKNLSKKKRRAELAQARAEARPDVSATNYTSAVTQAAQKTTKQDQNNVGSFPLPEEKLGASSSSSSSSSDSDSSDSDSDSSSGYGSDAGHSPKT